MIWTDNCKNVFEQKRKIEQEGFKSRLIAKAASHRVNCAAGVSTPYMNRSYCKCTFESIVLNCSKVNSDLYLNWGWISTSSLLWFRSCCGSDSTFTFILYLFLKSSDQSKEAKKARRRVSSWRRTPSSTVSAAPSGMLSSCSEQQCFKQTSRQTVPLLNLIHLPPQLFADTHLPC